MPPPAVRDSGIKRSRVWRGKVAISGQMPTLLAAKRIISARRLATVYKLMITTLCHYQAAEIAAESRAMIKRRMLIPC